MAEMALVPQALRLIAPHLRGARVLTFGHPDILAPVADAEQILGLSAFALQQTSPHGAAHKLGFELPDTTEAFRAAGVHELHTLDAFPSRGTEDVCDLNDRLPTRYLQSYALVIDAGTTEHCANVGQAVRNAAGCVGAGGRVLHAPPLTMANHGYFNFCPSFLVDLYEGAGWTVEHLSMHAKSWPYKDAGAVPADARFAPADGMLLLFMAQRGALGVSCPPWPTQRKYRR